MEVPARLALVFILSSDWMETLARIADRLRSALLGLLASCVLVLAIATPCLQAQDEEKPPEPKPPEAAVPEILKEGTLDLTARIYLPDKNSVPRLVPNVRLSDLIEWNIAQGRRSEGGDQPTYKFDQFLVEARVTEKLATLNSQIKLSLSETAQKVTGIPLRLQSCLLTEAAQFEGPGKSQVQVGRNDQPGYTWWLQADPQSTHTARLVGQTVVQSEGDRQSLQLTLPVTLATVDVLLPANYQDVSVRGQGGELVSEQLQDGLRRVSINCQGGDLNISWRTYVESQPAVAAAEVTSKTSFTIDDPAAIWEADSELSLRAHGETTIEKLVVDLPEGAQWIPAEFAPTEQYKITSEEQPATAPARPFTRLTIQATGRLGLASLESVQIRWRWTPPPSEANNLTVPQLQVRSGDRHEGTITLLVPASMGLQWKSPQGADLVQQRRIGTMQESVQYVFRFARQSQLLEVSFRREMNLADVKPTYLLRVERDGVKLTGWLQCAFDQTQQPELAVDMGPWQLDSAEVIADMSEAYAEGQLLDQQYLDAENPRVIKLSSQLSSDNVTSGRRTQQHWRINAHMNLNEQGGATAALRLPVPLIMLLAPDQSRIPLEHVSGALLVSASDNVLLTWDQQASQSLLSDALAAPLAKLQSPPAAERTLTYRFQSGAKDLPVWSGKLEILPRRVAAEQKVEIDVQPELIQVIQRFQLQIANEPLPSIIMDANGARDVAVLVDSVPWNVEALDAPPTNPATADSPAADSAPADSAATGRSGKLRAIGAKSLIGKVSVEIRSRYLLSNFTASQATTATEELAQLPLVSLELDDVVVRNPVEVTATVDSGLSAWLSQNGPGATGSTTSTTEGSKETADARWSPLPSAPFVLPMGSHELELRVARQTSRTLLPVRVTGAWLQTALSGTTRADRFCARFETEQDSLTIRLPNYDLAAEVAIDGIRQTFDPSDGRLQISLREFKPGQEHTLEVWTRSANTIGWLNKIEVDVVSIEGCPRFDQFYWQLVTASNQHLLILPTSVTPEWRWVWDRLWWQRHSPMDQSDLEQWLAATEQQPLAPAANKYVASSFGSIAPFEVWIASRLLLWLPIGLVAIGGSILVSLVRALRHPAALLLLVACVLSLAAVWPDLAILVGQTSLLALLIVLLYAATQAAIESRVRRRSIFSTRPVSGLGENLESPSLVRPASHGSSEIVATTRTQSPIVSNGGG